MLNKGGKVNEEKITRSINDRHYGNVFRCNNYSSICKR